MSGFNTETRQEAFVVGVFLFEDLDRHEASKYLVTSFPNFAHATDCNAIGELVTTAQGGAGYWPHLLNTAFNIFFMIAPVVL